MNDFTLVEQLIYEKTGLKVDDTRRARIEEVLLSLAASLHTDIPHTLDMLAMLDSGDALWQQLMVHLTVGETYFFRNSYHMQALKYSVFPELIQKRRAADFKYLNIWSAGCATGEEPYSIAILLRELLPDIADWTVTILATDINQQSLEIAKQGLYRQSSFRSEMPANIQQRYFRERDKVYELNPIIRRMVTFKPLNLITGDYPSFATRTMHQDVIICRNVTIYFDEPTTRRVIQRFHAALGQGGWLVVGHAEPTMTHYQDFQMRNFKNAIFYQKFVAQPLVSPPVTTQPVSLPKTSSLTTNTPVVSFDKVREAMDSDDWTTARALLDDIARQDPMNAVMHYLRGIIAMNTDNLAKAHEALRRALYCDPKCIIAHYAIGEVYEQQGNPEDARRHWLKAHALAQTLDENLTLVGDPDLTVGLLRELVASRLTQQRTRP